MHRQAATRWRCPPASIQTAVAIHGAALRRATAPAATAAAAATRRAHAARTAAAAPSRVVLVGFSDEEVDVLHENADAIWQSSVELLPADAALLSTPVSTLTTTSSGAAATTVSDKAAAIDLGRMIYFLGGPAQQLAASMNAILVDDLEMAPAIVGAAQERHQTLPLHEALASVRAAHAAYHRIIRPVTTQLPDGSEPPTLTEPPRLVMNLVLDRGCVLTSTGGERVDESSVVVIDGLLTDQETRDLLDCLTAPTHDHCGPPPGDKWEQACVDREGDAATWGLRPEVIEGLRERPPAAAVALQARLAALYPEWTVAHMPSEALLEGDEETPLSSHVANAVMYGDPCEWHLDMDPAALPPGAPFTEHAGYYYNRELGKPLFVTMMAYLNPLEWREEWFAETLFGDPETGTGVFVQPRPGRVVLMDQDMPHRISAPSRTAPGPRYSLVWKLVMWPKPGPATAAAAAKGGGSSSSSGCGGEETAAEAAAVFGLSRPEWGPPQRIGSAAVAGGRGRQPIAWPSSGVSGGA